MIFILLWLRLSYVFEGIPLDTVKGYADKVLDVLRDPRLKPESAKKVTGDYWLKYTFFETR